MYAMYLLNFFFDFMKNEIPLNYYDMKRFDFSENLTFAAVELLYAKAAKPSIL